MRSVEASGSGLEVSGVGFGDYRASGFRVLGFRTWALGFRASDSGSRVWGSGLAGLGFRGWTSGFRCKVQDKQGWRVSLSF